MNFQGADCFAQVRQIIEKICFPKKLVRNITVSVALSAVMFGHEPIPAKEKGYVTGDPFMALSEFVTALPDSEPLCETEEVIDPQAVGEPDVNAAQWSCRPRSRC